VLVCTNLLGKEECHMNLTHVKDDELLNTTKQLNETIRNDTSTLLYYLAEVEKRRLFAREGCDSLFSFCKRVLKCSDGQAGRRVNAARVLVAMPEIKEHIDSGELSLTAVSQAQNFFKREPQSKAKKLEILSQLKSTSTRDSEKILFSHSKLPAVEVKESIKVVSSRISEIKFAADDELLKDLERLKEIWSHELPQGNLKDLFKKMANYCREQLDPVLKAERAQKRQEKSRAAAHAPELKVNKGQSEENLIISATMISEAREESSGLSSKSKDESSGRPVKITASPPEGHFQGQSEQWQKGRPYIPAGIRQQVWLRDKGQCSYVDSTTGRKWESRHRVQHDHIIPYAKGGQDTVGNLRLRCFAHNQWHAIKQFGREKVLRPSG
jgi:hypothetical protein